MKKDIRNIASGFFILMLLSALSFSQGKNFQFSSAGIDIWYPDNWSVREHGVVYMSSKSEDINLQAELLNVPDLDKAVQVAEVELKAMFPQDPSLIVNDLEVNGMRVKEINKSAGNMQAMYYFFETPGNKFIRLFCITTKDIAEKYKSTISKIVENMKPI